MARSRRACPERSRGNPGGAYLSPAARSFSTTEAREQDLLGYARDGHGYIFSWTESSSAPGLCKAGNSRMLASSRFSAPKKDRGRSAWCGLRRLKSSEQQGQDKHRRGSNGYVRDRLFDYAPQALCHAINLSGAPLRMTILRQVGDAKTSIFSNFYCLPNKLALMGL